MTERSTRLLLIRHAHVDTGTGFTGDRICGWLDVPLSAKGRQQIQAFSTGADGERPTALYTSSLVRARATSEALGGAWALAARVDPDLREIHCGAFEGLGVAAVQREHAAVWARNAAENDDDFAWPGGESYRAFRERSFAALARIAARHPAERVAVVTHTGVITQVIGLLEGLAPACWSHNRVAPFSGTEVQWLHERPQRLLSFNVREWWRRSPPPAG